TLLPFRVDGSITSARDSLSSMSLMRASTMPCRSLAAWYSAFSLRSPCSRATPISREILGRSSFKRASSSRSLIMPWGVIGTFSGSSAMARIPIASADSIKGAATDSRAWLSQASSPRGRAACVQAPCQGGAEPLAPLPSPMRQLPLVLLFLATACVGDDRPAESPLKYTENAKRAYDEALIEYFDRDWEEAVPMFEEVSRKYGYSRY